MRRVARWSSFSLMIALALVAALAVRQSDAAVTRNVSMIDNQFVQPSITVNLGDTVLWKNNGSFPHTSTGAAPLNLWDSGQKNAGATFARVFGVAGTFPYICSFHAGLGMTGNVKVRIGTSATSGPAGTQFKLTVATKLAASPFVYDVQIKRPGGVFTAFRTGITGKFVVYNSTGKAAGTYQFRARLRNVNTGATSGWSPARAITVNP
jgi:plastocyanin